MDINRLVVCGRLTRDPEIKNAGGYDLTTISIAVGEGFKDKKSTSFFDVQIWGKLAGIVSQYASKGKQVIVDGRIKQQTWEDKDGSKRSKIVIIAESVQLIGSKSESNQDSPPARSTNGGQEPEPITEEDMF